MNRLESIKERVSKIGGTPWKATDYSSDYYNQGYAVQSWNGASVAKCIEEAGEVDFIANAPTDIEYLLKEIERLEKETQLTNEKIAEIRSKAYDYGYQDGLNIVKEAIRGIKKE